MKNAMFSCDVKKIEYSEPIFSMVRYLWNFIPKPLRELAVPKIKQTKYDYVISLGENCLTAMVLKEFGLREFSGPFDWIAGRGLDYRLNLILDGFHGFLLKEDLEIADDIVDARRGTYPVRNKKNGFYLPHDFNNVNLEISYPIVYEKYERRINRLLDKLKASSILMVCCSREGETITNESIEEILKLISRKYHARRLDILIVSESIDGRVFSTINRRAKKINILRVGISTEKLGSKGWCYTNYKLRAEIAQWINTMCYL